MKEHPGKDLQQLKRPRLSTLINVGILFIAFIVIVGYLIISGQWKIVGPTLRSLDYSWVAAALGIMIFVLLCKIVSVNIAVAMSGGELKGVERLAVSSIGQLYGVITPLAMGEQPAQLYYLSRFGIKTGKATSALLSKFIIYQIVLTVFAASVLLYRYEFFSAIHGSVVALALPAFALHFVIVIALIVIGVSKSTAQRIVYAAISLYGRIRKQVDTTELKQQADLQINQFSESMANLRHHIPSLMAMVLITALELIAFYSIPTVIILAFNLPVPDPTTTFSAAAFVLMIQTATPLPGGTGGAEGGFAAFFSLMFPDKGLLVMALLFWRAITIVLPIIIGIPFLFIAEHITKSHAR